MNHKSIDSVFFSGDIKIAILINSLHFEYYQIFIVLKNSRYLLYGEKYPGVFFEFGEYETLRGAKIAASKFIKPYPFLKNEKPEWGPAYVPEKIWLEKFNTNIRIEDLKIKLRIYFLKRIGKAGLLITEAEDLRERHFFMPEDELCIQGIIDNSGFKINIKKISPLSFENVEKTIFNQENKGTSIHINKADLTMSQKGQAGNTAVGE